MKFQDFRMEKLAPFGVLIQADAPKTLDSLTPESLNAWIQRSRLVVLRGFAPLERDEFLDYCVNLPEKRALEWNFGPVMEMKESADPKNYLFSREEVPFHWDGAFHQVPDYLVFNCVQAPSAGAGGETLFANTEMIYDDAPAGDRCLWSRAELTYRTEKLAHYGGEIRGTLVQRHPRSRRPILRFAEPVATKLNPVLLEVAGVEPAERETLVSDLTRKIYDERYCYRHEWKEGDVLIADNHALVHGRKAFLENCPRHLRRIQLLEVN